MFSSFGSVFYFGTNIYISTFLSHCTFRSYNIQFTMETGRDGHLPFIDIDIYRRPDGTLDHKVYRKSTPTNLYLNSGLHQHPSKIQCVFSTLVHGSWALCDKESLHDELEFLRTTFRENCYSTKEMWWTLNPEVRTSKLKEKPTSVVLLQYVQTTRGRPSRKLAKHNSKRVGLPARRISSLLRPMKDDLGVRIPECYSIPSSVTSDREVGRPV